MDGTTLEYTYNNRGELAGVVRRRENGTLRADWTHGYEYDEIGNRTLTVTPEGESLYRYYFQSRPTFALYPATKSWLRGRSHPDALVTVNGAAAERDGALWRKLLQSQSGKAVEAQVRASRPDLTPPPPAIVQTRRVSPGQAIGGYWETATGIEHDWNGNVTDDGRWTYEWDAERRPVIMEEKFLGLPGETQRTVRRLEMIYDAQGRRVSKKLLTNVRNANGTLANPTWTFQRETVFLWQDWTLLAEFVRLTVAGTPQLRRTYLWGLDVDGTLGGAGGVGGLLWVADHVPGQIASNRQLAPWYDGNGNILGWMENEGAEILPLHRLEYDPFGQTLVDDPVRVARNTKQRDLGVTDQWLDHPPFGFSTKYEDRETGLLYYGYRYYSPELGRWLSRDPIDERGGLNLYGMVRNNPVNKWDYLGLEGVSVTLIPAVYVDPSGAAVRDRAEDSIRRNMGLFQKSNPSELIFEVRGLKEANEKLKTCSCIKRLTFEGHGNAGVQNVGPTMNPNSVAEGYLGRIKMKPKGFEVFKKVSFCKSSCEIVFRGCIVAGDEGIYFLQWVADATGCKTSGWSSLSVSQPGGRSHPPGQPIPDTTREPRVPGGNLLPYLNE